MSSGYGFAAFTGGVTWIGQPRQTRGTNGRKPRTVVNFSVAVSKDRYNEETKEWEQDAGGKYYESVTAFGRLADNIIASLKPGDRVVVIGDRDPKPPYTDRNGVQHENENQITARAVGPDLSMWPWANNRQAAGNGSAAAAAPAAPAPKPAAKPATQPATEEQVFGTDEDDW